MSTTVTVEIKPTVRFPFQPMDTHIITATRSTRVQAITVAIAELIKVGGPELQSNFTLAQRLLPILAGLARAANPPATDDLPAPDEEIRVQR
jgi:hypothetical protein